MRGKRERPAGRRGVGGREALAHPPSSLIMDPVGSVAFHPSGYGFCTQEPCVGLLGSGPRSRSTSVLGPFANMSSCQTRGPPCPREHILRLAAVLQGLSIFQLRHIPPLPSTQEPLGEDKQVPVFGH